MTANQVCRISISDAMTANTHAMFFCLARKLQTHIRHFCVWRKAYAAHDVWALQSPSTEGLYMRLLRLARKLQMHIRHFCVWRKNFKCTFPTFAFGAKHTLCMMYWLSREPFHGRALHEAFTFGAETSNAHSPLLRLARKLQMHIPPHTSATPSITPQSLFTADTM